MGQLSLLFDGTTWAEQLGYGLYGETEVAWLFSQQGSGLHALKFKLSLPKDFYDPCLRAGSKVEVYRAAKKLGTAILSEPNRETWEFQADGLYRKAETTIANDELGNATSDITVAIEAANLRGLGWNGAGDLDFENLAYQRLDDNDDKATIALLFNNYCKFTGNYWGLDEDDVPFIRPRPTVPEWAVTPGIPLPPTTDEMSVRQVTVKYLTGGTTQNPTSWGYAVYPAVVDEDDEGRDVYIDITVLGNWAYIVGGQADTWAQQYYEQMQTRVAYTGDLDLVPGQLTNTGSVPIDFWASPLEVVGKLGLHHGALDKKRGTTDKTIEYPCGSVVFRDSPGGGSLRLAAVDFAPRQLPDVIAYMNWWYEERNMDTIDIFGQSPTFRR